MNLPELAAAIHQFLAANLPGRNPRPLIIDLSAGTDDPVRLTVLPATLAASARPANRESAFVPNAFQEGILIALDGKAMRTDALGGAVGDRSRLFRKPMGGLSELREHGLVEHHVRLGFYRPDAPPPD